MNNDFQRARQLLREGYSIDIPGFYRENANAVLINGEWLYLSDSELAIIQEIVSKRDRGEHETQ